MKTVKANTYKKALAELLAIDEKAENLLPQEISENDKDHYVCLMVKRDNNATKKRYETKVSVQQFDAQSFQKMIKNVAVTGYDYAIVLHNPDNKGTDIVEGPIVSKTEAQLREEIEADLRKEFEAKFGQQPDAVINTEKNVKVEGEGATLTQHIDHIPATDAAGTGTEAKKEEIPAIVQDPTPKTIDISGYTVDKLKAFAKENEIDIKGVTAKDDIIATLQTWQKEA